MCQNPKMRISVLQKKICDLNIYAIVIPSADPHQSEYLAESWKIREWLSGFTGSAGTLVVTRESAGLWTDSRYYLQAEEELAGSGIILYKQEERDTPSITDYLRDSLNSGDRIAINARLWSASSIKSMKEKLGDTGPILDLSRTLEEDLWEKNNRPGASTEEVFIHDLSFAGRTLTEKVARVRNELEEYEADYHLITTLDDIAWLLNLRGYDIAYNPVFMSYGVVGKDSVHLFIDKRKIGAAVHRHLRDSEVTVHPYSGIEDFLENTNGSVLVNPDDCNARLYQLIPEVQRKDGPTITRLLKACKFPAEIAHIDSVMVKDGCALAHAFYALFQKVKHASITEAEFAALIAQKRSEQAHYYGESFPAIIGYQANGAIVHYRPPHQGSARILPEGLLLCDSGGQYLDGTTDITRTLAMGAVSDEQKEMFTRVLKGHIAIDTITYPEGTTGGMIDVLARQYLWKAGVNFGHGTGHGVGYFLNVHEPPQGISPGHGSRSKTAFRPGMLTSNEPGYYKAGAYGIRIENLLLTIKSEHKGYLCHRHVTLFPIDTSLIVYPMMTRDEIIWVNKYHDLVASKLLPNLDGEVAEWVRNACRPI